jgi:MFS family permease
MPAAEKLRPSGRVAFTHRNFTLFLTARSLIVLAIEMQSVAVGWQVYDITKKPLDLGLIGLAQFSPSLLLFLLSGHVTDRVNRRNLLTMCYAGFATCSALLLGIAWQAPRAVLPIYGVVILSGIVRSFNGPVTRAILPQLVPEEHFTNAVAWSSSANQASNIMGPSIGGFVYAAARGPEAVYALAMAAGIVAALSTLRVKLESSPRPRQPVNMQNVLAGIHYIWRQKIVLGSISLDLFAVLLGGAVALLPVYAREILHTGPWGLGLLRCSPGIGAGAMALLLAHRPLKGRSGVTMLWCIGAFGIFTIVFGLSHNLILSMAALVMVGATDMVSVMVRAILVQLATPNEMRGRVNAVDMIFIGASNELGQFESGVTAAWLGTVPAVVVGGIGTLVVTALWAWGFPELREATDRPTATLED